MPKVLLQMAVMALIATFTQLVTSVSLYVVWGDDYFLTPFLITMTWSCSVLSQSTIPPPDLRKEWYDVIQQIHCKIHYYIYGFNLERFNFERFDMTLRFYEVTLFLFYIHSIIQRHFRKQHCQSVSFRSKCCCASPHAPSAQWNGNGG